MAVPERRINQTPNHRAEITRRHFQEARDLADAFELQLKYIDLGLVPKGIEVISVIQPDDSTQNIGVPHLWKLVYRNSAGDVCDTSLRRYGGSRTTDSFVSFEMRDSTTRIEWDMYGERKITES